MCETVQNKRFLNTVWARVGLLGIWQGPPSDGTDFLVKRCRLSTVYDLSHSKSWLASFRLFSLKQFNHETGWIIYWCHNMFWNGMFLFKSHRTQNSQLDVQHRNRTIALCLNLDNLWTLFIFSQIRRIPKVVWEKFHESWRQRRSWKLARFSFLTLKDGRSWN